MKAWQRQIRDRMASGGGDLLGSWWSGIDTRIDRAEVREIDRGLAEGIVLEYEWLGCMPAVAWHYYGIFFDGVCGGAVVYGPEYSENLGVWDKYGYTGKLILLSRGACVHWAHEHAASRLIRRSMDLLPTKFEVVTATTDHKAGEVGTIYQACGFSFAEMKSNDRRYGALGISSRSLRSQFGKTKFDLIKSLGGTPVKEHKKGRYFAFRGDRRTMRRHYTAISHLVRPYPKRQSSEANTASNAEARFDPALPLQT